MVRLLARVAKPNRATVERPSNPGTNLHDLAGRPVRVLVWPHWFDNPYLPNLVDGLRDVGVDVFAPHVLSRGSARLQPGDWLHVHWSTEAHTHHRRWLYAARAAEFNRRLRLLKRRGVRIAWTAHNLVPHDDPHPDLGHRVRADLLALADHVFIHFPGAQATLEKEFGYTGPCTVVHHPHYIDSHPAPPTQAEARAELRLPAAGFVALSFGLLRPYKGIEDIIRAFQQVAGDCDRLVLAGHPEGDVATELELARRDPRIVLHAKRIPSSDVPLYFAAADAAVIAHRGFFTSGSALLALSMGCPVVGPAVNHLADLAGGQRLYQVRLGVDGLAAGLSEARSKAPEVDRESLRRWAADYGTWRDAAISSAAVFRGGN
ncbi:glycosyltransferase [Mycolicibacterium frederiksbergense]|uniref:glycosyltransferase n=1 Tax=Mycolicibacterium frederiksbergense TaxID=117567 RepID=UPI00399A9FFB